MNMGTHVSLLDFTFSSFEYLPGSQAGSYGNYTYKSLKDCHSVYHCGYTTLHSHQWCTRVQISPHPCQRFLFFNFCFMITILMGEVASHYSLHFPKDYWCWASFHVLIGSSVCFGQGECLFKPFAHFWIGVFVCMFLRCQVRCLKGSIGLFRKNIYIYIFSVAWEVDLK